MKRQVAVVLATALLVAAPGVFADAKSEKQKAKRAAIDTMARQTFKRLIEENREARRLADRAVGYAVFDSFKGAFFVSAGGGMGVAVVSRSGKRTYMKMGTAGVGLGLGGQSYQVVFLFDTEKALKLFIEKGWHADATASAVVWNNGKNADATFNQGLAVFQVTNKGLMAAVDISGTKYWKSKKLNR